MTYQLVVYDYGREKKYVLHEMMEVDGAGYILPDTPEISGQSINEVLERLDEMRKAILDKPVMTEFEAFDLDDEEYLEEEPEEAISDIYDLMTRRW